MGIAIARAGSAITSSKNVFAGPSQMAALCRRAVVS
jgi:hypothetical protein